MRWPDPATAEFWQQVVSGLSTGGIYASLALALVIVYRSTRVINFAQGEMATFSAFIAWWLIDDAGWPKWGAFAATVAMSFAGGVLLERVVIRPVEGAPVLTIVIVTLGLLVALNGLMFWIWGGETRSFPSAFSTRPIHVGGVAFSLQDLGFIGVSLGAVALLYAVFQHTSIGLGIRASALDRESSRLLGIRVGWMLALGWGIAASLGALSGLMAAPTAQLDPNMMRGVLLYALAAAVLGGLESPLGAVLGGLVLGVLLNLLGTYTDFFSGDMRLVGGLAIILAVLLVRPAGVFGRVAAKKV
jgi:branched-chain amino acid transport system permease protein